MTHVGGAGPAARAVEPAAERAQRMARLAKRRAKERLRKGARVARRAGWASQLEKGLTMLGVKVTVCLTEQAGAASAAIDRAADAARRCGPRHTAARRAQLSFSQTDAATLKALEPRLLSSLSKDARQAALYVFDPCAALGQMADGSDAALLVKLRRLVEATGAHVTQRPQVPISRIRVEFEERKTIRPPKPSGA